ncbi:MAG: TonB-dependent receptor, partial [Tannerella sp.]|nr:TonB-dependent receptor [Tannerella sp.]
MSKKKKIHSLLISIVSLWGLTIGTVCAQNDLTVKGLVLDASTRDPLGGVSILNARAGTGTITDMDGKFTLHVSSKNAELKFSYLGYVSRVLRADQASGTILMQEDTEQLQEVVVVGYGTQKRVNLTGSVAQLDGKRLENRSVTNLSQALQGTVANLNISSSSGVPGSTQNINIRGYTGIQSDGKTSSGAPLVVVDGVQGGSLDDINMNDVENISVLKDAASAAIYGSSAPFGVIIVTTKKGRADQKPTITYNNNFGFSQPTNLPHYVNSLDFAYAMNEASENSHISPLYDNATIEKIKQYQAGQLTEQTAKDPQKNDWLSWNASWANNDWFDIYFKNAAFSQQHNLGVSGGSDKATYYVGLGYTSQDGLFHWANDNYQRYNLRANISSNLTNWLTFSFRGAFSREAQNVPTYYSTISGGSSYSYDYFHQLGRTFPTAPLKNPDGFYSEASGVQIFTDGGRDKTTNDNAVLTGEVALHPLPGWNITANYTYDGRYEQISRHHKTFYNTLPDGTKQARAGTSPNSLSRQMGKYQHHTINAFTSYEKTLSKHTLKAMVGFTQELYDNFYTIGTAQNLYSDDVPSLSLAYGTQGVSEAASQLAIRGGFGRLNYSYDDKYLIEFNGRYDGTSRFLKDVRYKFYPGVSAGWVVSKESFWHPLSDFVNFFKLRASYASLGDQSFTDSYYPFYPSLGSASPTNSNSSWFFGSNREAYIKNPGLINSSLTWVTSNTIDVGTDLNFLNNRLSASFDWYKRRAKDFVGPAQALPGLLGTDAPQVNNANIETTGWELSLSWKDRIGKVSYGATAVLSDYTGKVTKYNNPTKLLANTWYSGMTMGEIWGYETVGLFKDQAEIDATDQSYLNASWYPGDVHYADLNGNGRLDVGDNTADNPGDRRVIGNSTPRYQFGLNLNAEWNGFDCSVFLQGVAKRDIMFDEDANFFWGIVGGGVWQSSYFTAHTDRYVAATEWTQQRDGYFPRAYIDTNKNHKAQTRYLQNAAYCRIKNVQ